MTKDTLSNQSNGSVVSADSTVMVFELFCIDQKGKVAFDEVTHFMDALTFNASIWKTTPQKSIDSGEVWNDELKVKIDRVDTDNLVADLFASAFILRFEGVLEVLEPLRPHLAQHIRSLGFAHLRVLSDDVSAYLSGQIYPLINSIESRLRRFIVKFFITKIGLGWFDISVPAEVKEKLKSRQDNEPVLTKTKLIDTDVSLIDFNELGDIITRQTSIFSRIEDVVEKISSADSLDELRSSVTGHYPKYFKDTFEKQNFQKKWKTLFEIRNRVAHCNHVFVQDLEQTKELTNELGEMFKNAESTIDGAILSTTDIQAISKAILENSPESEYVPSVGSETTEDSGDDIDRQFFGYGITEERFLDELKRFEEEIKSPGWNFIGLGKFLDYLEDRGFNRHSATSVAKVLDARDSVAIEYQDNPHGFYRVASIRTLK